MNNSVNLQSSRNDSLLRDSSLLTDGNSRNSIEGAHISNIANTRLDQSAKKGGINRKRKFSYLSCESKKATNGDKKVEEYRRRKYSRSSRSKEKIPSSGNRWEKRKRDSSDYKSEKTHRQRGFHSQRGSAKRRVGETNFKRCRRSIPLNKKNHQKIKPDVFNKIFGKINRLIANQETISKLEPKNIFDYFNQLFFYSPSDRDDEIAELVANFFQNVENKKLKKIFSTLNNKERNLIEQAVFNQLVNTAIKLLEFGAIEYSISCSNTIFNVLDFLLIPRERGEELYDEKIFPFFKIFLARLNNNQLEIIFRKKNNNHKLLIEESAYHKLPETTNILIKYGALECADCYDIIQLFLKPKPKFFTFSNKHDDCLFFILDKMFQDFENNREKIKKFFLNSPNYCHTTTRWMENYGAKKSLNLLIEKGIETQTINYFEVINDWLIPSKILPFSTDDDIRITLFIKIIIETAKKYNDIEKLRKELNNKTDRRWCLLYYSASFNLASVVFELLNNDLFNICLEDYNDFLRILISENKKGANFNDVFISKIVNLLLEGLSEDDKINIFKHSLVRKNLLFNAARKKLFLTIRALIAHGALNACVNPFELFFNLINPVTNEFNFSSYNEQTILRSVKHILKLFDLKKRKEILINISSKYNNNLIELARDFKFFEIGKYLEAEQKKLSSIQLDHPKIDISTNEFTKKIGQNYTNETKNHNERKVDSTEKLLSKSQTVRPTRKRLPRISVNIKESKGNYVFSVIFTGDLKKIAMFLKKFRNKKKFSNEWENIEKKLWIADAENKKQKKIKVSLDLIQEINNKSLFKNITENNFLFNFSFHIKYHNFVKSTSKKKESIFLHRNDWDKNSLKKHNLSSFKNLKSTIESIENHVQTTMDEGDFLNDNTDLKHTHHSRTARALRINEVANMSKNVEEFIQLHDSEILLGDDLENIQEWGPFDDSDIEHLKRLVLLLNHPDKCPGFIVDTTGQHFFSLILQAIRLLDSDKRVLVIAPKRSLIRLQYHAQGIYEFVKYTSIQAIRNAPIEDLKKLEQSNDCCILYNSKWSQDTDSFGACNAMADLFKKGEKAVIPIVPRLLNIASLWAPLNFAFSQGVGMHNEDFIKECMKTISSCIEKIKLARKDVNIDVENEKKSFINLSKNLHKMIAPFVISKTESPVVKSFRNEFEFRSLSTRIRNFFIRKESEGQGVAVMINFPQNSKTLAEKFYFHLKDHKELSHTIKKSMELRTGSRPSYTVNNRSGKPKFLITTFLDGKIVKGYKNVVVCLKPSRLDKNIASIIQIANQFKYEEEINIYLDLNEKKWTCDKLNAYLNRTWLMEKYTLEGAINFFFDSDKEELLRELKEITDRP